VDRHGYPAARPEARGEGTPRVAPRYESIESSPERTAADTDALLFVFSGRPDAIDFSARLFPAIFTLQDELQRELGEVLVPVSAVYSPQISCNRVLVRNAVAGSNASVMVVGKWARARMETAPDPQQLAAIGP
jgi:hypothetical protein